MEQGLEHLNQHAKTKCLADRNDFPAGDWYAFDMSRPHHDWYLKQWLLTLGKKQRDIVKDLDWNKAKASLMVNCKQPYSRDEVNELASYLNLKPYELLMSPEEAMAIRKMRESAILIAAESRPPNDQLPPAIKDIRPLTGTDG